MKSPEMKCSFVEQSLSNALESGFMMQDDMLTISKLELPNAFLAVLSACETAKGDASQPDQVIHLAATMLYVRFRSVIGTMWCAHARVSSDRHYSLNRMSGQCTTWIAGVGSHLFGAVWR
jgi:hypothetical protein